MTSPPARRSASTQRYYIAGQDPNLFTTAQVYNLNTNAKVRSIVTLTHEIAV